MPVSRVLHARMRSRGFTLIELMIVLVILAVVLMIALPGFSEITLSTRLKAYANELVSSAYLARSEAIKRNVPVTLCVSTDGATCNAGGEWEQGWIVLDPSLDPNDQVLLHKQGLADGYRMVETPDGQNSLLFQPSGTASTAVSMKICRQAPEAGVQERQVTLSVTGRPRVAITTDASCP